MNDKQKKRILMKVARGKKARYEPVKVRIQCQDPLSIERVRKILLHRCPELILASPRVGTNPKYEGKQKLACYGDFKINSIRKRRKP